MQLSANASHLQSISAPVSLSHTEPLIFDKRHLPLPAKDITFMHCHNCCELGIVIKEKTGKTGVYKISMRSGETVDCSAICQLLGGGGHMSIAACQMEGMGLIEAIGVLKSVIDDMLENAEI